VRKGFFPASGQTTAYTADTPILGIGADVPDDGTVQAGKPLSYQDNGDGTVTDLNTGLIWEKNSNDGGLHDMDNTFPWSLASFTTIWDWLAAVNAEGGTGLAGHSDWRIPNVQELQSIVDYENRDPAVAAAFNAGCSLNCTVLQCSCTAAALHWSSTTVAGGLGAVAWSVDFLSGSVSKDVVGKGLDLRVRAVRGGCVP
jgi:hypothetical protein